MSMHGESLGTHNNSSYPASEEQWMQPTGYTYPNQEDAASAWAIQSDEESEPESEEEGAWPY